MSIDFRSPDQIKDQIGDQIDDQIGDQIDDQIDNRIDDQIEEQIEEGPSPNDAGMIANGPENGSTNLDTASYFDSRIEEIQSNVLAERVVISELHERISDSELRHDLRRATYCLDNIEDVFLSSARQDKRTPGALARWLSYAEFQLKMSAGRRAEVQGIVTRRA